MDDNDDAAKRRDKALIRLLRDVGLAARKTPKKRRSAGRRR